MAFGLPKGNLACIYSIESAGGEDEVRQLARCFEKVGYRVDLKLNATAEDLQQIPADCGVFYFNTHGIRHRTKDGTPCFVGLETGTEFPWPYPDPDDFLTLDFIAAAGRNRDGIETTYTALSGKFIRAHWRFPDNCLVFINGCHAFDDVLGDNSIWKIISKECNAQVYVGWTGGSLTNCFTTTLYFFDRLLGADFPMVRQESPPQRAFTIDDVYERIKNVGLDTVRVNIDDGRETRTSLTIARNGRGDLCLLAPSIEYVDIDETKKTVSLTGFFGSGTPKIRVFVLEAPDGNLAGAYELAAQAPENGRDIRCSGLSDFKKGSAGYIVAAADYGNAHLVRSNAVPITAWHGKLTYTIQAWGSPVGQITADLFLRGDIHKYREKPGGPLIPRECRFELVQDTTKPARFGSSGTFIDPVTKHKYQYSGEGTILPGARGGTEGRFTVTGVFRDPENVAVPQLRMALVTGDNTVVYDEWDEKNKVVKKKANSPLGLATLMLALKLPWKYGDVLNGHIEWPEADGNYETSYDIPCPSSLKGEYACHPFSGKAVISAELQWGTLAATYAPDDNTPG